MPLGLTVLALAGCGGSSTSSGKPSTTPAPASNSVSNGAGPKVTDNCGIYECARTYEGRVAANHPVDVLKLNCRELQIPNSGTPSPVFYHFYQRRPEDPPASIADYPRIDTDATKDRGALTTYAATDSDHFAVGSRTVFAIRVVVELKNVRIEVPYKVTLWCYANDYKKAWFIFSPGHGHATGHVS